MPEFLLSWPPWNMVVSVVVSLALLFVAACFIVYVVWRIWNGK